MNDFLKALPWQIASGAALVVGAVAFATGASDVWSGLTRVGLAFIAFFILGVIAKALLSSGSKDEHAEQPNTHTSVGHGANGQHPEAGMRDPTVLEQRTEPHDTNL